MPGAQANPKWEKAEIILALDLYFNHDSDTKHGSRSEKKQLSETLRRLHLHDNIADPETFRNLNGVETKIANLQYLDPDDPATGLSSVSALDREVWDEYHDKPELVHQMAESIAEGAVDASVLFADLNDDPDGSEQEYPEGRILYKMHKARERSSAATKAAKEKAIKEGGLFCCVCGFDFEKTYGEIGKGFIECHHIKPISEYKKGEVTKADDLALVCPNCHRMLHRGKVLRTPGELKAIIHLNQWMMFVDSD